jgi:hypothetical protein
VVPCTTTRCNYTEIFATCPYSNDPGNYEILFDANNNDEFNFVIKAISVSGKNVLNENETVYGSAPTLGNSYLSFSDIPPSRVTLTHLGTINSIINFAIQDDSSTQCTQKTDILTYVTSPLIVPLICPSTGVFVLSSTFFLVQGTETNYTAVRNSISTLAFSDQSLNVGPISNVKTNVLSTFSVDSQSTLTFTVTTTQPAVRLTFDILQKSDCKQMQTFRCNNYPCERVTPSLPAGSYYLQISDSTITPPPAGNYSFNVSYVYGSSECRNITDDLNFCLGHLSTQDTYKIPDQASVDNAENNARVDYDILALSWSTAACNDSLVDYACKSNFQGALCEANGDTTKTLLCKEECVDSLSSSCLGSGEAANLCERSACQSAANSINACRIRPPPGAPSGVLGLHLGLSFSVLTIFLLRIFNN